MKSAFHLLNILIAYFLAPVFVFAQSGDWQLRGQIIDAETQKGIPFATISLVDKPLGTAANESGFFQWSLPALHSQKSLRVACVGYQTQTLTPA